MLSIPIWNPSLSVGNPVIDRQHQALLLMCQRLVVLLADTERHGPQLLELINDVAELMKDHFETEERLLRINGCPNFRDHVSEHESLYQAVLELLGYGMYSGSLNPVEFEALMTEWLTHHLLDSDLPNK